MSLSDSHRRGRLKHTGQEGQACGVAPGSFLKRGFDGCAVPACCCQPTERPQDPEPKCLANDSPRDTRCVTRRRRTGGLCSEFQKHIVENIAHASLNIAIRQCAKEEFLIVRVEK